MPTKHPAAGLRLRLSAVLLGMVLISVACTSPIAGAAAPQWTVPRGDEFFFGSGSLWRTPVPAGAAIDKRSAAYVAALVAGPPPTVAVRNFTASIFVADATTPRYRIEPTASYATPEATLNRVPIPANAAPDPQSDGHMAVLDMSTTCVFEMYRAKRTATGWAAEWVNATPADGDGVYPDGLASRASGFSITAGLIWPEELRAGHIDHALVFAYPRVRRGGPVPPATRSDGTVGGPDTLPEGAHLVLDPSLDLSTLGLSRPDLTIATALQRYGMYLADSSRGLSLFAVHPQSYSSDPYVGLFEAGTTYEGIAKIPFTRMKVLKLGTPTPAYQGAVKPNRCSDAAR